MAQHFASAKRIVIKIGSAQLVDQNTGTIHYSWLTSICEDIAKLWQQGKEIIIVSSGAIALGKHRLHIDPLQIQLEEQQAAAAIGQILLAHAYQEAMNKHGISIAQILLTLTDSENRQRYLNAKNTLATLLKLKVIPIINENDTVATSEIRYGDNDRLSARVAQMASAEVLVLLSDIDGLYTADPHKDATAQFISEIREITPEIEAMGQGTVNRNARGGMKTKLIAAKIVMESGCHMVICSGKPEHPLAVIDTPNARCTWFIANISPRKARKNWLAQHLQPHGSLLIDEGAINALKNGKSLLSAGVIDVEGDFRQGDPISICSRQKQEIARGLSNYPAHEARMIMGRKSQEFEDILGYQGNEEIVHRDDLVVL